MLLSCLRFRGKQSFSFDDANLEKRTNQHARSALRRRESSFRTRPDCSRLVASILLQPRAKDLRSLRRRQFPTAYCNLRPRFSERPAPLLFEPSSCSRAEVLPRLEQNKVTPKPSEPT